MTLYALSWSLDGAIIQGVLHSRFFLIWPTGDLCVFRSVALTKILRATIFLNRNIPPTIDWPGSSLTVLVKDPDQGTDQDREQLQGRRLSDDLAHGSRYHRRAGRPIEPPTPPGEAIVEIPTELLAEALRALGG
jgi:hypothetical protein